MIQNKTLNLFFFILSWTIVVQLNPICAQSPNDEFYQVSTNEGLELGEVRAVFTDNYGLLWLGTSTGLHTYDGYKFQNKQYTAPILTMAFDSLEKQIWIGNNTQLVKYDNASANAQELNLGLKHKSSDQFNFKHLLIDDEKNIWAASSTGLFLCHTDSDTCQAFQIESDNEQILQDPYLNRLKYIIQHDHPDSLWLGSLKGIYSFSKKTGHFRNYLDKIANKSTIINSILNLDVVLIAGTFSDGLAIISKDSKNVEIFLLPVSSPVSEMSQPNIYSVRSKDDHTLWLSTEVGLYSFDLFTKQFKFYSRSSKLLYSGNSAASYDIMKDNNGHWWVGFENGLSQWDPSRFIIKPIHISQIIKGSTKSEIVVIGVDQNNQVLLYADKIGMLAFKEGKFEPVPNKSFQPLASHTYIHNIQQIAENLWLFSDDKKLYAIDPIKKKKWTIMDKNQYKESDFHYYLSHVFDEKNNILWMGRQWGRGFAKINLSTGSTVLYDQQDFIPDSLVTTTGFKRMVIDQDGNIWFPLGIGLGRYNPKKDNFQRYGSGECTGVGISKTGKVWASFFSKGIFQYHQNEDSLVLIKGLNEIGDLTLDTKDNVWIVSNDGLLKLDAKTKTITTYTTQNGLPKNNLYGMMLNVVNDDMIALSTFDWLAFMNIDERPFRNKWRSPYLVEMEVKGTAGSIKSTQDGFTLAPNQNSISFYFPALNYKPHNLNRYRHRLIGLEENWISNHNSPQVSYNNLVPGNYKFQVQTSFNNSEWRTGSAQVFTINQLWWKSNGFKIMMGILVLTLTYILYRWRTQQIRREEALKIQMAELEMEALRAQMNPHFIFNALNSVKHFILSNDKFLAAEYLSNFSLLVRKILNNSKSPIISLEEEISTLKLYLEMEKLRFSSKFEYLLPIEKDIDLEEIKIPPLILQPYAENAIWHGIMHKEEKGLLQISIRKEGKDVICVIEDNGIGRKKAKELKTRSALNRKSYGMQITQARIEKSTIQVRSEIIDLEDEDGIGIGTRVVIYLPIQNDIANE